MEGKAPMPTLDSGSNDLSYHLKIKSFTLYPNFNSIECKTPFLVLEVKMRIVTKSIDFHSPKSYVLSPASQRLGLNTPHARTW
jgi:hypothetical protein